MSRIEEVFKKSSGRLLNVYFTAGFPNLDTTISNLRALEEGGADLVEIGMPYSDPLADGTTIQYSSSKAIKNGMSIEKLFEQLSGVRDHLSLPILLMGYLNPIMQFGPEKFCEECERCGVDGLIIPDLPIELYDSDYKSLFQDHGLDFVFLITPETPEERIRMIDDRATGFIYMVSSSSTTGSTGELTDSQLSYFKRINDMKLKNPRMIGFGISDNQSFIQATDYADGAIVGSAFIKHLDNDDSKESIVKFVKDIKG